MPYSRSFKNIQILPDVSSYNEKIKLMKKCKEFKIQKLLDFLSNEFNIQIHLIYCNKIFRAGNKGSELFIRINPNCFIFHEHVGKIVPLPPGLGKTSRSLHKLDDMIKHKFGDEDMECNYSLSLETKLEKIEEKIRSRINVWKKTVNGKNELMRCSKEKYFKKINLHFCSVSKKLFLIIDEKLYFRGQLQQLKHLI